MEKIFHVSELKEFARIINIADKRHMLKSFTQWFKTVAYGFYLNNRRCDVVQNHYGFADLEWQQTETLARQDYNQMLYETINEPYHHETKQWFDGVFNTYNNLCQSEQDCLLRKRFVFRKWFLLLQIKWQKMLENRKLSFVDVMQIARSSYLQKGGTMADFQQAVKMIF